MLLGTIEFFWMGKSHFGPCGKSMIGLLKLYLMNLKSNSVTSNYQNFMPLKQIQNEKRYLNLSRDKWWMMWLLSELDVLKIFPPTQISVNGPIFLELYIIWLKTI